MRVSSNIHFSSQRSSVASRLVDKTRRRTAVSGGEGGIRTHGEREPTAVFKTAALNHSATSPTRSAYRVMHFAQRKLFRQADRLWHLGHQREPACVRFLPLPPWRSS